ncbi:Zinc finger, RING/FYVE/PHD-type [Trema orientale]|uniref:Zinc finger, RING/FYVE/PHD-type n=1 Tax=Trema orientale TaxID=63057 RepID=A0A2P5EV60_TREOI|nr:Zinc finger, RING/FYVE/PHD-type [Trema orientale]
MPKVRRVRSLSFDQSRASPYPCTSKDEDANKPRSPLGSVDDVKEWEETRCPICMEHPHNAVLLKCSSYEKGCRPYMCNTSYRHSNCLDQFCKSSEPYSSTALLQEIPLTSNASRRISAEQALPGQTRPCGSPMQANLACPLCRGDVFGYIVIGPARQYMNTKVRSCSSETCDFSGTYSELRKHARSEHPSVRPSEVDPSRQRDWTRLEQERDLDDVLSLVQPGFTEGGIEDPSDDFDSLMASFFSTMFHSIEIVFFTRLLDASRDREQSHNRRSDRMSRSYNDVGTSSGTRRSNNFHESNPHARRLRWRSWRPDNDAETVPPTRPNYEAGTIPTTGRNSNSFQDRVPHELPSYLMKCSQGFKFNLFRLRIKVENVALDWENNDADSFS